MDAPHLVGSGASQRRQERQGRKQKADKNILKPRRSNAERGWDEFSKERAAKAKHDGENRRPSGDGKTKKAGAYRGQKRGAEERAGEHGEIDDPAERTKREKKDERRDNEKQDTRTFGAGLFSEQRRGNMFLEAGGDDEERRVERGHRRRKKRDEENRPKSRAKAALFKDEPRDDVISVAYRGQEMAGEVSDREKASEDEGKPKRRRITKSPSA